MSGRLRLRDSARGGAAPTDCGSRISRDWVDIPSATGLPPNAQASYAPVTMSMLLLAKAVSHVRKLRCSRNPP